MEITDAKLRDDLTNILDLVAGEHEVVIVRRNGARDVALIPATELSGLLETAHLLRSPRNAQRLMTALHRAERGDGLPSSLEELRRETNLTSES